MEFPGLGKHCSEPTCRQLDFLPVKCDACNNTFCSEHYKYESHNCPAAYRKNVQVPVCPLCNTPIPGKSDELPDIRVSRHIDSDCQSDRAVDRRKKVYTNRCSYKGCKQKELIPVICDKCGQNFCLRHRHAQDHSCSAPVGAKSMSKAALAALSRTQSAGPIPTTNSNKGIANGGPLPKPITASSAVRSSYSESRIQGNLSEDAALAMALQASMAAQGQGQTGNQPLSQEQEDFLYAQAIAASEEEARRGQGTRARTTPTGSSSQRNCQLS